jgi:hypothetical protein
MNRILLVLAIVSLLGLMVGCAHVDGAKTEIVSRAADFSDQAAEDAVFVLCRAITVGTWRRKFGADPDRAVAWRALCSEPVTATP